MQMVPDFGVFTTVFFYCSLIIVGPVVTFFVVKLILLDGMLGVNNVTSSVWSAILAVIVLHIALGMFIVKAYSDSGKKQESKDDKID
ncbi:vacuolar ATPase assembly integral membrane protein VMA21 homolog [Agrilus planipennis]|uniref:Vacuolar ATPase assembly integral membrane protein VMA21 homolog n=1 Tax=Agrilus planipennis TaxID=224129 RepID=A0A1W4X2S6_AGRPL|nr:vacuolar ATPase assembly integral membrane protein VMA21 homolog [Agrilus planipennis]